MQPLLADHEEAAIADAAQFAREVVNPQAGAWEVERRVPTETLREAAAAGLTGLVVAEADGGRGLSFTAMARVMEELASADMAFAFSLVVHNNLMRSVANNGTPAQKERYLPALKAAETIGAFLLTEPRGGSDAAAIETTARRDGDGWVIDGAKSWITNATSAGLLSVYAQTDPAAGGRGIACFLVEADAPGVQREPPYRMLGGHAMGAGGFRFEGCRVADEAMMIAPGQGFKAALGGIDLARANVAAMCCGIMRSGLDTALEYVSKRPAFGQTMADFQGLQWMLADVATDLHASRLMAYEATRTIDASGAAPMEAAHAKKFATRAALKGLADCMQVMGANGMKHDYPLARHLAGAKLAQYLDGATEIQNVVISRALFRPYRQRAG